MGGQPNRGPFGVTVLPDRSIRNISAADRTAQGFDQPFTPDFTQAFNTASARGDRVLPTPTSFRTGSTTESTAGKGEPGDDSGKRGAKRTSRLDRSVKSGGEAKRVRASGSKLGGSKSDLGSKSSDSKLG